MINRGSKAWLRRDAKMARLPLGKRVTIKQAALCMGITYESLRERYIKYCRYELPAWIEKIYDGERLVALRRISPGGEE